MRLLMSTTYSKTNFNIKINQEEMYNLIKIQKFKYFPQQKRNNVKIRLLRTMSKIQRWIFHFVSDFNLKKFPDSSLSVCISVTNNKIG